MFLLLTAFSCAGSSSLRPPLLISYFGSPGREEPGAILKNLALAVADGVLALEPDYDYELVLWDPNEQPSIHALKVQALVAPSSP